MKDSDHGFSLSFKKRRKELNLRQQDIADKLGVSVSSVSNWEQGLNSIDADHLIALANLLDISIDELVGRQNTMYLTDTEKSLIHNYRIASDDRQSVIRELLHVDKS